MTVLAAGSTCLVQDTSINMLRCVTSEAILSEEPIAGNQGVRRLLWKTSGLTTDPSQALTAPDTMAELSEVLPGFNVGFDGNAEPFVQTLTSVLTMPDSFSGNPHSFSPALFFSE